MFLINSRYPLFSATSSSSDCKNRHPTEAHLLPKLRCQFAEFLNQGSLNALEYSSRQPVSVYGTGARWTPVRDFSWKRRVDPLTWAPIKGSPPLPLSALALQRLWSFDLLPQPPTGLNRDIHHPADLAFFVLSHHHRLTRRCRNIDLLAIVYAFRPRLRTRLTLGG